MLHVRSIKAACEEDIGDQVMRMRVFLAGRGSRRGDLLHLVVLEKPHSPVVGLYEGVKAGATWLAVWTGRLRILPSLRLTELLIT